MAEEQALKIQAISGPDRLYSYAVNDLCIFRVVRQTMRDID